MGDFRRCAACGEYGWFETGGSLIHMDHVCKPVWEARIFTRKWEEDWATVHASDAEEAAAKFCEEYDCGGDYDIVRRGGEEIEVRKSADDPVVIVDVEAESVPHYHGHERKPAEAAE